VARVRQLTVLAVAVFALAGSITIPSAHAQSGDAAPKATEIGVSATEIRIAVEADVDNPFVPGLFKGVVDGVRSAAKYLNSKSGGGGIGGRKLVVDFIDSKLNGNEARNGVITACQNDFAMVGTAALFLPSVDDMVGCTDKAGAATGLPDIGAVVTGVAESCSPVSFPVNPPQLICSTKDQSEQTYYGNQGDSQYLLKTHKNDLHGSMLSGNDTKDAQRGGLVLIETAIKAGIKADQNVSKSGRDPQSAYTPVINQMKADGSNYSFTTMATSNAIELRSEAQLQGLTSPDIVWMCTTCYDSSLKEHADVMNDSLMRLSFLPFEEASTNPTLANFVKYIGKDKADSFSVYGWTSTLAFAEAARAVVEKGGVNALTRASMLSDGIPTLTKFDAGGMIGAVNLAEKIPTACFMIDQFENGKFVRVYPSKKGTFDCKASNTVKIKADLIG
jgi:hypothetical protein